MTAPIHDADELRDLRREDGEYTRDESGMVHGRPEYNVVGKLKFPCGMPGHRVIASTASHSSEMTCPGCRVVCAVAVLDAINVALDSGSINHEQAHVQRSEAWRHVAEHERHQVTARLSALRMLRGGK